MWAENRLDSRRWAKYARPFALSRSNATGASREFTVSRLGIMLQTDCLCLLPTFLSRSDRTTQNVFSPAVQNRKRFGRWLAQPDYGRAPRLWRIFVKKSLKLFTLLVAGGVLFALISSGGVAQAQQTTPNTQQSPSQAPPPPQSQPPDTTAPQQSPSQQPGQAAPDRSGRTQGQAQSTEAGNGQEFVGTVVKQGNKYMFQDSATGQTYDIDHQDEVKKFDGKKVRVRGTLDPQTKTIHVQ